MKKFFNVFFVVLGVIFLIVIILGVYMFVVDPYNIKPLIFGSGSAYKIPNNTQGTSTSDTSPSLDPSKITPEQEACFVQVLGQARVDEIKAGSAPTATDYFSARGCI